MISMLAYKLAKRYALSSLVAGGGGADFVAATYVMNCPEYEPNTAPALPNC